MIIGFCDICQLDRQADITPDEEHRGKSPMTFICWGCRSLRERPKAKCPACRHPRHRMRCTIPCKWWIRLLVRGRVLCDCEYWDARWMEVA